MSASVIVGAFVGVVAAVLLLMFIGWLIRFARDFKRRGIFAVWARLYWLPEPVYYWLLDRFTDNKGWRPLFYRGRDR